MNKRSFWYRTFDLYYDGFRSMTLGKKLWLVIFIQKKQRNNATKGHWACHKQTDRMPEKASRTTRETK